MWDNLALCVFLRNRLQHIKYWNSHFTLWINRLKKINIDQNFQKRAKWFDKPFLLSACHFTLLVSTIFWHYLRRIIMIASWAWLTNFLGEYRWYLEQPPLAPPNGQICRWTGCVLLTGAFPRPSRQRSQVYIDFMETALHEIRYRFFNVNILSSSNRKAY